MTGYQVSTESVYPDPSIEFMLSKTKCYTQLGTRWPKACPERRRRASMRDFNPENNDQFVTLNKYFIET